MSIRCCAEVAPQASRQKVVTMMEAVVVAYSHCQTRFSEGKRSWRHEIIAKVQVVFGQGTVRERDRARAGRWMLTPRKRSNIFTKGHRRGYMLVDIVAWLVIGGHSDFFQGDRLY